MSERKLTLGHEETVLVVEDNPLVRQVLVTALELMRYKVVAAGDGAEALAYFAGDQSNQAPKRIDLVLSDLLMPGMNGEELMSTLRARCVMVPFLILTAGVADYSTRTRVDAMGGAWVSKPVDLYDLGELVAAALEVRREDTC